MLPGAVLLYHVRVLQLAVKLVVATSILAASVVGAAWLATDEESAAPALSTGSAAQRPAVADAGALAPEPADAATRVDAGLVLPDPLSDILCPGGMSWVSGTYCPANAIGERGCRVDTREMGFCIDRHEYPNQVGVVPAVMVPFPYAAQLCSEEGKRLCRESEWTFACQKPLRSRAACNFGQTSLRVKPRRFWRPEDVAEDLAAIDGRRASRPSACVTRDGVYDLLGNVQEWVESEHVAAGYSAALKGGRYNQGSIDCERSVQTRLIDNGYPHTGFRCCADPLVKVPQQW